VRVFFGSLEIVFFLFAARAAFRTFFRAADFCLELAIVLSSTVDVRLEAVATSMRTVQSFVSFRVGRSADAAISCQEFEPQQLHFAWQIRVCATRHSLEVKSVTSIEAARGDVDLLRLDAECASAAPPNGRFSGIK